MGEANINIKAQSVRGAWIISIIWLAYCFTQMVNFSIDKYLCHSIWFLWMAALFLFNGKSVSTNLKKKRYLLLLGYALFYFLSSLFSVGASVSFNRIIALLEMSSPILMYDIFKYANKRVKIFTMLAFLAIIAFNTVELVSIMNIYGLGLRGVVNIDADEYFVNAYNWAYTWIFIVVASVLLFRMSLTGGRSKCILLLYLVLFCVGFYMVVRSFFMTAILLMLISTVLAIFYGRKRWLLKVIFAFTGGIIVFIMVFNVIVAQFGFMEEGGDFLTERTGEIYHTLIGEKGHSGDLDARSDLTSVSLATFLKNPIIGINHKTKDFSQAQYTMVGDHSEWIDSLALCGLFFLLLFSFLVKSAKCGPRNAYIIYFTYFLTGFLNPLWYFPQNSVVFYFIPIAFCLFYDNNKCEMKYNLAQ